MILFHWNRRLQDLYESGTVSDRVLTKDVLEAVNRSLLQTGETGLTPSDVGRLVRLAFGPSVERKSAKIQGTRSYMYCGIGKKATEDAAKRPCLVGASHEQEILPAL